MPVSISPHKWGLQTVVFAGAPLLPPMSIPRSGAPPFLVSFARHMLSSKHMLDRETSSVFLIPACVRSLAYAG